MDRFTSGYKSEYITLMNEVEVKMKRIIHDAVVYDRDEISTNFLLLRLIKDFAKHIPENAVDKKNMIKALLASKDDLWKNHKREMNKGLKQAKNELGEALKMNTSQLTIQAFFELLHAHLKDLDIREIQDVTENEEGEILTFAFTKGYPYIENYYKHVRDEIGIMVEKTIKEPKTKKGVLSVRSLVELELRDQFHKEQKKNFINNEIKIVRISSHADCSKRCEPYQNKLYSLDGTSGTINGENYEPIEKATDIFTEPSKTGRVWKNGLFGFNCRHRMIKYEKGMPVQDDYTHEEMEKEREVSETQRSMERMIFKTREKAILMQPTDAKKSASLRRRATKLYENYVKYSQDNNHAFYPDRCAISRNLRTIIVKQK